MTTRRELVGRILERIKERKPYSVLDTGAGYDIAEHGVKLVTDYVVLEPDPERANALRNAGLRVIEKQFPCWPEDQFFEIAILPPEHAGYLRVALGSLGLGGMVLLIGGDAERGWTLAEIDR